MGLGTYPMLIFVLSLASWSLVKASAGPFSMRWNHMDKSYKADKLSKALENAMPMATVSRVSREAREDVEDMAKDLDMALIVEGIRRSIIRDITETEAKNLDMALSVEGIRRSII